MQNDPRSHGLWERTAPPAPETGPLIGDVAADVLVVGAGFTGLSAALHLAQGGARVVVLEASEVGFGGSGRNVGLVNAGLWLPPDDIVKAIGADAGERLVGLLGAAPQAVFSLIDAHGIACEAERSGTLHCAVGAAGLRDIEKRAAQWTARGAAVRVLDAAETTAKVGSRAYTGALLDTRAGTIQPLAYVRGLAGAALKAGASIHGGSPVIGIEQDGSGWTARTAHGRVTAAHVVVATNAYTHGPWPQITAGLVRLPYFQLATEPLGDALVAQILPERQGVWDTRQVMSSFRLDKAGRLVFGSIGALRGTGTAIHTAWARRAVRRLFPALSDVKFTSEWFGWIGMTGDALPRFQELAPRVLSVSGYNGRGIGPGTVFGRALAELILGTNADALPLPRAEARPASLRSVRSAAIEAGSQLFHAIDARV